MEYYFDFSPPVVAEGVTAGIMGVATGILVVFALFMLAFGVLSYVMGALGMHRLAKRRGIHHAWLAWIPVGSAWLLGSISDHYQYVAQRKLTSRRKILLAVGAAVFALTITYCCLSLSSALSVVGNSTGAMGVTAVLMVVYVIYMAVAVVMAVFQYIAYYDLFRSCKPGLAVVFLVLSIFFNVTLPFFVFACSGSDQGMPARRKETPPPQTPYEPFVDQTPVEEEPAPQEENIPVVEAEVVETEE